MNAVLSFQPMFAQHNHTLHSNSNCIYTNTLCNLKCFHLNFNLPLHCNSNTAHEMKLKQTALMICNTYLRQIILSQLYFWASCLSEGSMMPPRRRRTRCRVDSSEQLRHFDVNLKFKSHPQTVQHTAFSLQSLQ